MTISLLYSTENTLCQVNNHGFFSLTLRFTLLRLSKIGYTISGFKMWDIETIKSLFLEK